MLIKDLYRNLLVIGNWCRTELEPTNTMLPSDIRFIQVPTRFDKLKHNPYKCVRLCLLGPLSALGFNWLLVSYFRLRSCLCSYKKALVQSFPIIVVLLFYMRNFTKSLHFEQALKISF